MRSGSWRVLVPGLVLACLAAAPRTSTAQAGRAELTGEVRDGAGAVVPQCQVTVTEVATNVAVVVTTGPDGLFNLPYLRPGSYRIAVQATSFRPTVREAADASLLQTESSGLGEVVVQLGLKVIF